MKPCKCMHGEMSWAPKNHIKFLELSCFSSSSCLSMSWTYHNLPCHTFFFAVVMQHPTAQLMNKRHVTNLNQISLLSQYNEHKYTGDESLGCRLQRDSMDDKWINSWIYMKYKFWIYIYATHIYKGLNSGREQYMLKIMLYKEHELKTIIITVHIHLCSKARYELVQTECQGA